MSLAVTVPVTAATTLTVAAASEITTGPWGLIIGTATVCTAITVIAHFTHAGEILCGIRKLSRLAHLQESFLEDWNGEPARDGVDARPSFPARMARLETRVTDHRKRNDDQIRILQEAVDSLGRDQLLVDTARAILTELGHDGELPPTDGT